MAALMTALACVTTMIIKIPSPLKGYINLGDCIVLLSGWLLSPVWGFFAAGLGSALADVLSGYVIYGPATFLIKGLMALVAFYGYKLFKNKCSNLASKIISGIAAEIVMLVGYFFVRRNSLRIRTCSCEYPCQRSTRRCRYCGRCYII